MLAKDQNMEAVRVQRKTEPIQDNREITAHCIIASSLIVRIYSRAYLSLNLRLVVNMDIRWIRTELLALLSNVIEKVLVRVERCLDKLML